MGMSLSAGMRLPNVVIQMLGYLRHDPSAKLYLSYLLQPSEHL